MPPEILELHNDIFLGIDLMFVNGIPFFITASSKIKFVTVEEISSRSKAQLLGCLKSVIKLYNRRNLRIGTVAGDEEFDCLKTDLEDKYNITYNPAAKDEHVAEVERMICVVKERICASCSRLP